MTSLGNERVSNELVSNELVSKRTFFVWDKCTRGKSTQSVNWGKVYLCRKKVPPPLLNLSAINRKLIVLLFGFFIQTGTRDNLSEVDFSFNRQWVQKIQNEHYDINLTSVTAVR